jgi:hypothetical protein
MILYRISRDYCRSDIELLAIATGDRRGRWREILHFFGGFHAAKNLHAGNPFVSVENAVDKNLRVTR